jgi:hypothetical protein
MEQGRGGRSLSVRARCKGLPGAEVSSARGALAAARATAGWGRGAKSSDALGLTFRQSSIAKASVFDGPCDPGNPSPEKEVDAGTPSRRGSPRAWSTAKGRIPIGSGGRDRLLSRRGRGSRSGCAAGDDRRGRDGPRRGFRSDRALAHDRRPFVQRRHAAAIVGAAAGPYWLTMSKAIRSVGVTSCWNMPVSLPSSAALVIVLTIAPGAPSLPTNASFMALS